MQHSATIACLAHRSTGRDVRRLLVLRRVARPDAALLSHGSIGASTPHYHLFTVLIDHIIVHNGECSACLPDQIVLSLNKHFHTQQQVLQD